MQPAFVIEAVPTLEINHNVRQMHNCPMREIALWRLVSVSGDSLETGKIALRQAVKVTRSKAHEKHCTFRNLIRSRNAQPLSQDSRHADRKSTRLNSSH